MLTPFRALGLPPSALHLFPLQFGLASWTGRTFVDGKCHVADFTPSDWRTTVSGRLTEDGEQRFVRLTLSGQHDGYLIDEECEVCGPVQACEHVRQLYKACVDALDNKSIIVHRSGGWSLADENLTRAQDHTLWWYPSSITGDARVIVPELSQDMIRSTASQVHAHEHQPGKVVLQIRSMHADDDQGPFAEYYLQSRWVEGAWPSKTAVGNELERLLPLAERPWFRSFDAIDLPLGRLRHTRLAQSLDLQSVHVLERAAQAGRLIGRDMKPVEWCELDGPLGSWHQLEDGRIKLQVPGRGRHWIHQEANLVMDVPSGRVMKLHEDQVAMAHEASRWPAMTPEQAWDMDRLWDSEPALALIPRPTSLPTLTRSAESAYTVQFGWRNGRRIKGGRIKGRGQVLQLALRVEGELQPLNGPAQGLIKAKVGRIAFERDLDLEDDLDRFLHSQGFTDEHPGQWFRPFKQVPSLKSTDLFIHRLLQRFQHRFELDPDAAPPLLPVDADMQPIVWGLANDRGAENGSYQLTAQVGGREFLLSECYSLRPRLVWVGGEEAVDDPESAQAGLCRPAHCDEEAPAEVLEAYAQAQASRLSESVFDVEDAYAEVCRDRREDGVVIIEPDALVFDVEHDVVKQPAPLTEQECREIDAALFSAEGIVDPPCLLNGGGADDQPAVPAGLEKAMSSLNPDTQEAWMIEVIPLPLDGKYRGHTVLVPGSSKRDLDALKRRVKIHARVTLDQLRDLADRVNWDPAALQLLRS